MGFLSLQSIIPPGTVLSFAGASAPAGWELCDGRAVSRTTYAALFAAIGTAHGSGDGSTTFNIPDYRWTFLRGHGQNISVNGSGTAASNNATFTGHGLNRTGVKVRLSSGALSGLSTATDYWVIVVDSNTLAFAATKANAIAGTKIALSGTNTAVIVQYEDPDATSRASNTSGANSAATIGSYQSDAFRSHGHSYDRADRQNVAAAGTTGTPCGVPAQVVTATTSSGDNETRPSNVSVNYIIKT